MRYAYSHRSSIPLISHPNIISYKESFFEDATNSLCLVMEYADNGDLNQKIEENKKRGTFISEYEIWNIFINSLMGLKTLHEMNICHRDMKVRMLAGS